MALKALITGQINLVNEVNNQNFLSFDLSTLFGAISNVQEHIYQERMLSVADSVVSLHAGGVSTAKGFLIAVEGGVITVKNDANTAGIKVSSALVLFGQLSSITVETAATQPIKIKYLLFE
jgi:hypothetical protein